MTETKGEYSKITWQDVTVKIGTLKPWEGNPKTSTKKDARALLKSWDELGQFQTIAIGPDGDVYDGHQRLSALMVVYGSEYQVAARVSSRPLTDEERRKIAIYSRQIGAWDWDILSSWQPAELMEWGFDSDLLKDWKRDTAALDNFLKSEQAEDDKYTAKVETPIYEIKGDNPELSELYDDKKYQSFVLEINKADIPEDIKHFLRLASTRHIVFDFSKIAEFYAHAEKHIQELMENNALVIIDFNKAIELGYVQLSEKIAEQFSREYRHE